MQRGAASLFIAGVWTCWAGVPESPRGCARCMLPTLVVPHVRDMHSHSPDHRCCAQGQHLSLSAYSS